MSPAQVPPFAPDWLALREEADAAARAVDLIAPLRARLEAARQGRPRDEPLLIWDLGCGTGSLGRWLAARLPGPQHWVLCDRDPDLLARAAADLPAHAADGAPVTARTRRADLAALRGGDLEGADLVAASALLDLLTPVGVEGIAAAVAHARCPALFTLSVVGRVELDPADPLDAAVAAAFNAHQRRGGLLGPDAATAAAAAFERHGMRVRGGASPWVLGPDRAALTAQWLRGWVAAACEQRPDLAPRAADYLRRRLRACAEGGVRAVVHHTDLLALPAQEREVRPS